ncbi:MAG: DUF4440 domain-containing protein [Woeseiaceae bacterium]
MKNVLQVFLASAVLISGCATMPDQGAQSYDDEQAIRAHADAWLTHYLAGDIDALMALYEPDAVVALHDQPVLRGKKAIRAYFAPGMGKADVIFKLNIEKIDVSGNRAWLVSQYWLQSTDKVSGYVYEDAGRSLIVYRKGNDGRWRMVADIDNNTPDVTMDMMPVDSY